AVSLSRPARRSLYAPVRRRPRRRLVGPRHRAARPQPPDSSPQPVPRPGPAEVGSRVAAPIVTLRLRRGACTALRGWRYHLATAILNSINQQFANWETPMKRWNSPLLLAGIVAACIATARAEDKAAGPLGFKMKSISG